MVLKKIKSKSWRRIAVPVLALCLMVCYSLAVGVSATQNDISSNAETASQVQTTDNAEDGKATVSQKDETIMNTKASVTEICFIVLLGVLTLALVAGCAVTCYLIIQKRNLAVAYLKTQYSDDINYEELTKEKQI